MISLECIAAIYESLGSMYILVYLRLFFLNRGNTLDHYGSVGLTKSKFDSFEQSDVSFKTGIKLALT